jgi:hypothetical protein
MKTKIKLLLVLLLLAFSIEIKAQVTQIWTDYDGYWTSSSTSINTVRPDNTHNLLAFRFNGTIYSTDVNNDILDANGVIYVSENFRALPVTTLPLSGGASYFAGLGANFDGLPTTTDNSATSPFNAITTGNEVADFITRGVKGLDLGSCLTNIPLGTISTFNLSSAGVTESKVGDGIPDILISQVAQPSGSGAGTDQFYFVDSAGDLVGNRVTVDLNNATLYPSVGNWNPDFYNFNGTGNPGSSLTNSSRGIRFFAIDFSAFGLTTGVGGNVGDPVSLKYEPRGSSDPAFLAFNEPSLGVASTISVISQSTDSNCDGTLAANIQVQVEDFNNNAVAQAGFVIEVEKLSGPGTLTGTLSQTTDATGVATFDDLDFSVGGIHSLKFSFTSLAETNAVDIVSTTPFDCPNLNDFDDDGITDDVDIDDDNDGILDSVENDGNDPYGDEDDDGTLNFNDTSDDGDGGPGGTTSYVDLDNNGIPDVYDFDGDGIANMFDLDSDNDGIPDNVEAQPTTGYISPSGVVGANGLDAVYENNDTAGATGLTPENTDGAGNADYLDLDADGDGIFDIVESGSGLTDANNDGRTDGSVGNNGLDNLIDTADNYLDVNGIINDPSTDLNDLDGDLDTGGELDYRDTSTLNVIMETQVVIENNVFTSVNPATINVPPSTITYTLGGNDAADFTINSSTGVVSMVARDFENPVDDNTNNFYNLTITATTTSGSASNDFTVIVANDCELIDEVQNTLRATDALGDVTGDTGTLQVVVADASGTPRSGVTVTITQETGPGTITAATGTTNGSGIYTTTVSSNTAGIATYSAQYAAATGAADTDVELGNPTAVRFLDDIDNVAVTGEVGIATDAPDPSSVLEIVGTDKGLLIPSVALVSCADQVTIPRPAESLLIYNTNDTLCLSAGFVFFNGTRWVSICQEREVLRE